MYRLPLTPCASCATLKTCHTGVNCLPSRLSRAGGTSGECRQTLDDTCASWIDAFRVAGESMSASLRKRPRSALCEQRGGTPTSLAQT